MGNCLNYRKSKYPIKGTDILLIMIYCVIFYGTAFGWRFYLYKFVTKNFLLICIYTMTLLLFVGMYCLKEKQLLQMEYISNHSKKCLNATKKSLYYFGGLILFVMLIDILPLKIESSDVYNLSLLLFIAIVGYMLMNYQFIVGFGNREYISGDGKLCYGEIDKIEEIKRVQTMNGMLVYSKIKLFDNKICYDKFLVDEYMFLLNKIADRR